MRPFLLIALVLACGLASACDSPAPPAPPRPPPPAPSPPEPASAPVAPAAVAPPVAPAPPEPAPRPSGTHKAAKEAPPPAPAKPPPAPAAESAPDKKATGPVKFIDSATKKEHEDAMDDMIGDRKAKIKEKLKK